MTTDRLAPAAAPSGVLTAGSRGGRMEWMDQLRGAAIVLVLIWHAPAIPVLYGATMPQPLRAANMFFLPYRMPTLMVLSGLLLPASLRKPAPVYYLGKLSALVWPYVLWVTVDRMINGSLLPWWHWRAWFATSYLWFLFFVGVYYFLAPLIRRLPSWLPVVLFAAAAVVLPTSTEERLAYFGVFFFFGQMLARHPAWLERLTRGRILWVFGLVALAFGVASSIWTLQLAYRVEFVLPSLAGIFCAIALARWVGERGRDAAWLNTVGRNSLVYYTSHFPIMTGTMYALYALGVHQILVVAAVDLVVAAALGAALVRLRGRPPVSWLFQSPARPTRWVRRRLEGARAGRPAALAR